MHGVAARVDGHGEGRREKKKAGCMEEPKIKMCVGWEGGAPSLPSPLSPPPPSFSLRSDFAPAALRLCAGFPDTPATPAGEEEEGKKKKNLGGHFRAF